MKKRLISVFLSAIMLFNLAACTGSGFMNLDKNCEATNSAGNLYDREDNLLSIPDIYYPQNNSQEYPSNFIENEFIKTSDENVSTFSADVDTASYSYFRSLVQNGYSFSELKSTSGHIIRTEEMINYFDYGYAQPSDKELFSTSMQIAPCPWNENASLLVLGLQTRKIEFAQKNNLVFLIDVSGSMDSKNKLELLKDSFSYLIDNLGDDDIISIVTYSGKEEVVLDGCSGADKSSIENAVNYLSASGSTNGEAGLKKAYEIAEKHFIENGNNRIIMASDGDLNVGISSATELERFISQKRQSGVFMSVLGFGSGNYQDEKMERIADCGNGVYYYIDSLKEAEKVFCTDIFSTLCTIAKDVKLQFTFSADVIDSYRLVGYENRLLNNEDFENDNKDAGDLGTGHSVTVCYELIFKEEPSTASQSEWMTLSVRYKAPDEDKSEEQSYSFGAASYTEAPNDNFKFICSVIETSMLIHQSKFIGDITLYDVKANLASLTLDDEYKNEFGHLIDMLISNK